MFDVLCAAAPTHRPILDSRSTQQPIIDSNHRPRTPITRIANAAVLSALCMRSGQYIYYGEATAAVRLKSTHMEGIMTMKNVGNYKILVGQRPSQQDFKHIESKYWQSTVRLATFLNVSTRNTKHA